jgi:hypothetical protein
MRHDGPLTNLMLLPLTCGSATVVGGLQLGAVKTSSSAEETGSLIDLALMIKILYLNHLVTKYATHVVPARMSLGQPS